MSGALPDSPKIEERFSVSALIDAICDGVRPKVDDHKYRGEGVPITRKEVACTTCSMQMNLCTYIAKRLKYAESDARMR